MLRLEFLILNLNMLVSSFLSMNWKHKSYNAWILEDSLYLIFDAEKAFSLCLNVYRGYVFLQMYLDAFWLMIWGESLSILKEFSCIFPFGFDIICSYF